MKHGTAGSYRKGCRCDACRAANTAKCHAARLRRNQRLAEGVTSQFEHGRGGYTNWGCRCAVCAEAGKKMNADIRSRAIRQEIAHRDGPTGGSSNNCPCVACKNAASRRNQEKNGATLPGATHHGRQWTGAEMEIVATSPVSARELAEQLGRSYYAVVGIRARIQRDPKLVRVVGLSRGTDA